MIAAMTNYGRVLRYCFQLRIASVHACIYAITANAKTTFLLVCHSNKFADEKKKRECYCHSL